MKNSNKKIIYFILFTFIIINCFILLPVKKINAATTNREIPLQVRIPGLTQKCAVQDSKIAGDEYCVNDFGQYMIFFYRYFIGVAGILSAVMVIAGGLLWITAAGNQSRIANAKATISGAVIGLILALTSYILFNTISPQLLRMKFPEFESVTQVLQAKYLCRMNPDRVSVNGKMVYSYDFGGLTDDSGRPAPECGISYKMSTTAGFSGFCMGDYCPNSREVCFEGKIDNMYQIKCLPAEEACKKTDKNLCESTDQLIQIAARETRNADLRNKVCRKYIVNNGLDGCWLYDILKCPATFPVRVDCSYGIGGRTENTQCWDIKKSQPRYLSLDSSFWAGFWSFGTAKIIATCMDTSLQRVGTADSICCAQKTPTCAKECTANQVSVTCGAGQCPGQKCCLGLLLTN